MDDCRVEITRADLRDRADLRMVHDDRVTLDMRLALVVADRLRVERLDGISLSDGSGDDLCGALLPV